MRVASRVCNVPSSLPTRALQSDEDVRARHGAWVQRQHECEEVIAGGGTLRPLSAGGIRWAKWWVPGSPTLDVFGNVSSLDAEQLYAPSDPLEAANVRGAACAREVFCMQALLKSAVIRAAGRPLHAHGASSHHGGWMTRRGEHSAALLLAKSGQDWPGVAGLNRTRLAAMARALGCGSARWEGKGWCTPAPLVRL